jgi:hypothetical protein
MILFVLTGEKMRTLKGLKNKEIRDFLGCKACHASLIKSRQRLVPRNRLIEFSRKFDIPLEELI